jgi:hypothetical protein
MAPRVVAQCCFAPMMQSVACSFGSLLDLFQTRFGPANPISCFIELVRVHWHGSRNGSCHRRSADLHCSCAFDRKFPVISESIQSVIDRLSLDTADATATHGVVEHAVAILPRPVLLPVCDIVQHGGIPIFSLERSAHDRPEITRDGCPIDFRSGRRDPHLTVRIGVTQFIQEGHCPPIRVPSRHRLAGEVAPFGPTRDGLINASLRVRRTRRQDCHKPEKRQRFYVSPISHVRAERSLYRPGVQCRILVGIHRVLAEPTRGCVKLDVRRMAFDGRQWPQIRLRQSQSMAP